MAIVESLATLRRPAAERFHCIPFTLINIILFTTYITFWDDFFLIFPLLIKIHPFACIFNFNVLPIAYACPIDALYCSSIHCIALVYTEF